MYIGILGAGRLGTTLARLFLAAGHSVKLANSRGPLSLTALISELGAGAWAGTPAEIAANSDVVVLATRWEQTPRALQGLGSLSGIIVVDATNPRFGPGPHDIYDLGDRSSSEVIASLVPGAHIVKAFNHAPISALEDIARDSTESRKALFLSGDDRNAKALVASLMRDIGAEPIDVGNLCVGGRLQDTGRPLAGHGRLLLASEGLQLLKSLPVGEWTSGQEKIGTPNSP